MPQSSERIRDKMREFQEAYIRARPPSSRAASPAWATFGDEARSDYGGGQIYHLAMIVEFRDGKVWRDTRYYAEPFEPPAWRARWIEPMEESPPRDGPSP